MSRSLPRAVQWAATAISLTVMQLSLGIGTSHAHQDPCHRRHSCPPDHASYVCGDKGRCDQCPDDEFSLLHLSTGVEVRLIGEETPETTPPKKPGQPLGTEASAFAMQLVEGKKVRLEFDMQRQDKSKRLLAYVYVGDLMLNAELVRQGYAQVAISPPNVKYQELFLQLQRDAREAKRGLWGER